MASRYRIPSFETPINRAIGFIFYFRLVWVLIAIGITGYSSYVIWCSSIDAEKLKNCAIVFSAGSVIIGIFYSIINYEHNLSKFKHDVKSAKDVLTFNTACNMHNPDTIGHFRTIELFYKANEALFKSNKNNEINELFLAQPESRVSFIVILNYFESISVGIDQGIMDEAFIKDFFKTIFMEYFKKFDSYIGFLRNESNSDRIFVKYTALAQKWKSD